MSSQNEYRSLMLRKAQLLAQEHGGISNIPRELQTKSGFDIIAGRKGSFSISVRIPEGDLSSRIAELKSELPKITFESAKPDPERIFGKYVPQVSLENPTMDDFWIMQGWYKEGGIGIRLTQGRWRDGEEIRLDAIRFLVEKVLKKDPRDVTAEDFCSNRLSGMLQIYYGKSPYLGLTDAGYQLHEWEMGCTPMSFYKSRENRVAAIKWLVEKLEKDPREIGQDDFNSNRLGGLLAIYYKNSPYAALVEAGYEIQPWEMQRTPFDVLSLEENRVKAVRWLVEKTGKKPNEIIKEDFYANGLSGVLRHYSDSPYAALTEAGYIVLPWKMDKTPTGFFEKKENRIFATRWLVHKMAQAGKSAEDLTNGDFESEGLRGLIRHYGDSPHNALVEAGYAYSELSAKLQARNGRFRCRKLYPWEMQKTPEGFYKEEAGRVAAVRWLVQKLQKEVRSVSSDDFKLNGLAGLLINYYGNSPSAALAEAGYKINAWEMDVTPTGFYLAKENRIAAIKWLAEKLEKPPREILGADFHGNGLWGLLGNYYHDSPYEALLESGLITPEDEAYMRSRSNTKRDAKGRYS